MSISKKIESIGELVMDLSNIILLTGPSIVLEGDAEAVTEVATAAGTSVAGGTDAAAQPASVLGGFGGMGMILYIVGLVALFYFFIIRPQKKREKEMVNLQSAIKVGDWVMTSSGFYGKVADISDEVFVVEFGTNKGVRVPIKKSEIIGNKEPNLTTSRSTEE